MVDLEKGYPKERFPDMKGDSFDCGICYLICKEPRECVQCGAMYCTHCINDWIQKKNECPIGCSNAAVNIRSVGGALSKIYRNLDIRCRFLSCGRVVKVCELSQHEVYCQLPKCEFYDICGNSIQPNINLSRGVTGINGVCGDICAIMKKMKESNNNWMSIYEAVRHITCDPKHVTRPSLDSLSSSLSNSDTPTIFQWDQSKAYHTLKISDDLKSVYLNEDSYIFRTVIGNRPMTGGIHYWEIHADPHTENELKIGVTLTKDFGHDASFSDYDFGYAYYGLGQLRHNTNSSGKLYGKRFKQKGVLGVCLNMNKGTLSFALDEDYWDVAFRTEALKRGPIYAAVSLLRTAGFTLVTGNPIPTYFMRD